MEVFDAISTRRAVRRFADRAIPEDALERIVEAGRLAPSSMNEQRWAFIVCTDRAQLEALSHVGVYADHLAGAAAAIALVTPEPREEWERESIAFDLGQCAENLMLAAWDLGIGAVHASVYDESLARQLLGYPAGMRCDYVMSFGYPASPPRPPGDRRPLGELVHRERW
jgi:nitroreductase